MSDLPPNNCMALECFSKSLEKVSPDGSSSRGHHPDCAIHALIGEIGRHPERAGELINRHAEWTAQMGERGYKAFGGHL